MMTRSRRMQPGEFSLGILVDACGLMVRSSIGCSSAGSEDVRRLIGQVSAREGPPLQRFFL